MSVYNWYEIFNLDEFEEEDLVSKTYQLTLSGIGLKEILVTKGNNTSIVYDDVFLSINMNDKNPFEFEDHAVYLDSENNVWLGTPE